MDNFNATQYLPDKMQGSSKMQRSSSFRKQLKSPMLLTGQSTNKFKLDFNNGNGSAKINSIYRVNLEQASRNNTY